MLKSRKSKVKPALPAGFRDFGPTEVKRRRAIINKLASLFELYGYEPLETPAVELLSVLGGKYGDEGDKLLFRILNSGDFLSGVPTEAQQSAHTLLPYITEKALRYDLTVPMARWIAQHAGELVFPFKRYQIQPVWRADRPQRGRFREFYQCDIDIIGGEGILPLVEIIHVVRKGLEAIGIRGAIFHLNHRLLLEKAAEEIGWPSQKFNEFCTLLDKTDKIGWENVKKHFSELGFSLPTWLAPEGEVLSTALETQLQSMPETVSDLPIILSLITTKDEIMEVRWDATLARGLDYYTGYIYEVKLPENNIGSIGAGGAYASLVGDFGGPELPAIGFSFGIERILTILQDNIAETTNLPVLVAWIDASPTYIMRVIEELHDKGIPAFPYPSPRKLSRQLDYAQRRGFEWVIILGTAEESTSTVQLKNLKTHTQHLLPLNELAAALRN
ncbi:MAG: histidine--tRNA ligase [Bacteroidia bacterium]|nr:histidine--tRNA ligase [Bacteroidia bacterium]MDW8134725.1 histidine--tRNA ligase [Bacteroidia bacterium]